MKKFIRRLLIIIFVVQSFSAQAAFEDRGVGGRAAGMGEAHVAVADDANAVYYNPAGLIQIGSGQISTEYGQFVKGLDDGSTIAQTYLSYAQPWKRGHTAIGLAYQNFNADNLFSERTITAGIGKRLPTELFGWRGIWSVGANLKQLYRQYEPDRFTENALNDAGTASGTRDPLFGSGYNSSVLSTDLGILYQFGSAYNYSAGAVVMNANRPDTSLGGDNDKAPLIEKFGLAYRPVWGLMSVEFRKAKRLSSDSDTDVGFGFERHLRLTNLGALSFRGGYQEGSRGFKSASAGMSYHFAKMVLDYAFLFPMGNLSESNGTHRMGVTFKLGSSEAGVDRNDYSNTSLLTAFAHDSLTQHVMMSRAALNRQYNPTQRDLLLRLLLRKYPLDDPGLAGIRGDISALLKKRSNLMEWPQLLYYLTSGVPAGEKSEAEKGINALVQGDLGNAKARFSILSSAARKDALMMGIILMALGQEAARAYRDQNLDKTIDQVRQMIEILPNDDLLVKAYRELLAERSSISESFQQAEDKDIVLPEAPHELVAPQPVTADRPVDTKPTPAATEFEILAKSFGTALGYYFTRKVSGASVEERLILLNQMKAVYGPSGMDMNLIDRELEEAEKLKTPLAPKPATEGKPAVKVKTKKSAVTDKPVKKITVPLKKVSAPVKKAIVPPVVKTDLQLERDWDYYKQASDRNITDHERVEILKGMIQKYGERGAAKINKELERIRRRMSQ